MPRIVSHRAIEAPIELVFETLSRLEQLQQAIPQIVRIESLTDQRMGIGTRFLETRRLRTTEGTVEFEVVEFVKNKRIGLTSEAAGAVWETFFRMQSLTWESTELHVEMEAYPGGLISRMMVHLVRKLVRTGVEQDLDSIKLWCEQQHHGTTAERELCRQEN